MDIIIYIFMFITGVVLGSFYTLAVYRIPLKQDITHTRSYCPKCNHRLNFWDLIPVLSYIFLGGKCRYCKERIRPRYIMIELLSGIVFLLFGMYLKIDILNIDYTKIVTLAYGVMFLSTVIITVGIFKEYKNIEKSVFNFGLITSFIYMIYLYILNINQNIYRYIICAMFLILFFVLNNKSNKLVRVLCFILYFAINTLQVVSIV